MIFMAYDNNYAAPFITAPGLGFVQFHLIAFYQIARVIAPVGIELTAQ